MRFGRARETERTATRPAYGWRQKEGARRAGTSVPLAGIQLSKSRIGLFGWDLGEKRFEASWYTDGPVRALRPGALAGRPG